MTVAASRRKDVLVMKTILLLKLLMVIRELRRRERWRRARLEAYQADALRELRVYAYARSSFYRRFHKGLADRPLAELPVLTKSLLMEHFDDVVTDRDIQLAGVRAYAAQPPGKLFLDRYWVTATSGSSGRPGFFLFDTPEWLTVMASFARGQEWAGAGINLLRRRRMATVASVSAWHMSAQVAAAARTWWTPSQRLAASDPLDSIVHRLNAWQPHLLIAYASMTRLLAEEQNAGRLRIRPATVFTSSEVLTDETRRRIQQAWGVEPFNQYAATETADIAAEHPACRHLHVFEDLVIIEVVDEHYRPVPRGMYGAKLLVTTLFSRTQPLIRYEINDSVRLAAAPCPSGLPFAVLDGIQGREEEALSLPAIAGGRIAIQPLVFHRLMDVLPVSGWQILQGADDGLTILLSGAHPELVEPALVNTLQQALADRGVRAPSIEVRWVAEIPKAASGKAPLIKACGL